MNENYTYALKLLTGRNYFVNELIAALDKKFPGEDNGTVIERLKSFGYLNDGRLFRDYIRWKVQNSHGEYYIKEKLYGKGIETSVNAIKAVIEEDALDLDGFIRDLVNKYRRMRKKLDPAAFKRACLRYLMGRGYAIEDSLKILNDEVIQDESDFFEGR